MLFLFTSDKEKYLNEFMHRYSSVFAVKIFTLYKCHIGEVTDIWVQIISGKPTALVSDCVGYVTLSLTDNADLKEIAEFVRLIGYKEISFESRFKLFNNNKSGTIMKLSEPKIFLKPDEFEVKENELKQAYTVLKQCSSKSFNVPDFESFYLDMSHKIRHGGGYSVTLFNNEGVAAATASAVFKCDYGAVIGAVAVLPQYRRNGLGSCSVSLLVKHLIEENIKKIYLQCTDDNNIKFYEKLGFSVTEGFSVIT